MLKETNPSFYKYFEWEGTISPNIKDLTGRDVDTEYMMLNDRETNGNTYRIYNVLKVEVDGKIIDTSKYIELDERDKKFLPGPDTIDIKSENGIFDGKKIQRGFRGERWQEKYDSFISVIFSQRNKDTNKTYQKSSYDLGFSVSANTFKYLGSENKTSRFSKLYYISKNASTTPCDSFGKILVELELPKDIKGFDNIISENIYSELYTSVVPIKSDVLSRAKIVVNKKYTSSSFSLDYSNPGPKYFTFAFYISPNFIGDLRCNANVLKLSIDNDVKSDDDDNVEFSNPQYLKNTSINIKSGNKKYNRVVLICDGSDLNGIKFTFEFLSSNNGIIYNPILYKSRFENKSSSICADLRGQGMKLTFSGDISEFNNKLLGGYKLHADYVPPPFYEIID